MADENVVEGPVFSQQEMEMVTFSVYETAKHFFMAWQDDVNDIEKQETSELFNVLLARLVPYSQGIQSLLNNAAEHLSTLSEDEINEIKSRVKTSDLDNVFADLPELS